MSDNIQITLQIVPNKWCDPQVACDATRIWDNTTLCKLHISYSNRVCASNTTSRQPKIKSQNQYAYPKLW